MRIAIGADHAGFALKEHLKQTLARLGHAVDDHGTHSEESVDYPPICINVGRAVVEGRADRGIVLGGSGQGEQIAANKVRGVRAALCNDLYAARLSREHNDANVLSMGGRIVALRPRRRDSLGLARHAVRRRPAPAAPRADSPSGAMMATETGTPTLWRSLAETDPEIAKAIKDELHRQNSGLELIASENFVSRAILEAAGSVFTNKYAEGYPGRRYYGGCEYVDVVERVAIARAMALFGAEHANVQPHSGAQANMAVYFTLLKPGDTVLGMNLAHGGHLTHGHPLNFSGKLYTIVPYGVRKSDERIDYDELDRLADEHKPKMIMVGASAYPRVIDFARIRTAADRVGRRCRDRHGAHRRPRRRRRPSQSRCRIPISSPPRRTRRCAGRGRGLVLCRERYAKDLDRNVFPGVQGGPLVHIIAAKAVCLKEAAEPAFADYQRQIVAKRTTLAGVLTADGFRLVSGGTDNHLMLVDVFSKGITGKVGRGGAGKGGHHGEQERHPVRSEAADGRQRDPRRHARRHDARDARARDGSDRRFDHSRAEDPGRRSRARHGSRRSRGVVPEIPPVPGGVTSEPARPYGAGRRLPPARTWSGPRSRPAARSRAPCPISRRAPGRSRWRPPWPACSIAAACCWPKPARAPARRSRTWCPPS